MMADRYAERLAARGYAALSFDFAGFGESQGEPRGVEDPARTVRDIRHALTFLTAHPEVDGDRLSALGICAAATYMSDSAAQDPRVRSLALVAPWLHDAAIREDACGGADAVAERVKVVTGPRFHHGQLRLGVGGMGAGRLVRPGLVDHLAPAVERLTSGSVLGAEHCPRHGCTLRSPLAVRSQGMGRAFG
ncbi:alpha/beta hydrolase [Streptomyces sp. NPDC087512]|uniref:alpha/beta hydrolase n=1 Tax=Streptomyces sp. NPDC087512 TaxID=3155059 RepID=UPI00343026D7